MSLSRTAKAALAELHSRGQADGCMMMRCAPAQDRAIKTIATGVVREIVYDGSNRSMKTAINAYEAACWLREIPVTLSTGEKIQTRKNHEKSQDVLAWAIGQEMKNLGNVWFAKLFRPGAFGIIRDEETGLLRAWMPWLYESDRERHAEDPTCVTPGPPLIPKDKWKAKAWHIKGLDAFHRIDIQSERRKTSQLNGYTSNGDPPAGVATNRVFIDEKLETPGFYPEMRARIIDYAGTVSWSCFLGGDNAEIIQEVVDRADKQAHDFDSGSRADPPVVYHFNYSVLDNPFIADKEKREFRDALSDEERRVRFEGQNLVDQYRMYPQFREDVHAAIPSDPAMDDRVARDLRDNGGVPPSNWTRDLVVDPGTQRPAALLCAVPPPELWPGDLPVVVAYREVYGRRMNARELAEGIHLAEPNAEWRRFVIDGRAGRQTTMGAAQSVQSLYSEAFKIYGIRSVETDFGFVYGSDNFETRHMMVNEGLDSLNGPPRIRVVIGGCPHLVKQLKNNKKKKLPNGRVEEVPDRRDFNDVRVCLEYEISTSPDYRRPSSGRPVSSLMRSVMREFPSDSPAMRFGPGVIPNAQSA